MGRRKTQTSLKLEEYATVTLIEKFATIGLSKEAFTLDQVLELADLTLPTIEMNDGEDSFKFKKSDESFFRDAYQFQKNMGKRIITSVLTNINDTLGTNLYPALIVKPLGYGKLAEADLEQSEQIENIKQVITDTYITGYDNRNWGMFTNPRFEKLEWVKDARNDYNDCMKDIGLEFAFNGYILSNVDKLHGKEAKGLVEDFYCGEKTFKNFKKHMVTVTSELKRLVKEYVYNRLVNNFSINRDKHHEEFLTKGFKDIKDIWAKALFASSRYYILIDEMFAQFGFNKDTLWSNRIEYAMMPVNEQTAKSPIPNLHAQLAFELFGKA